MGVVNWPRGSVVLVLAVFALLAASCSTLGLGEEEQASEDTIDNAASEDIAADEEEPTSEGGEDAESEAAPAPSIWTRADDSPMRPDQPTASLSAAAPPTDGGPWTIVGSEFDYELNRRTPVVWEADNPDGTDPWTRTDIEPGPEGDTGMSEIVRTVDMDIVVGSRGRDSEQRPSVWIREGTGNWETVDAAQFDGDNQEWLHNITAQADGNALLALGTSVTETNKYNPVIWLSEDGATWTQVANTPFADNGTEHIRGAAIGPDRWVVTGWQSEATEEVPVAWWSEDGNTWNTAEVELPAGVDDAFFGEAVWFQDRFVVVGGLSSDGLYRPVAWTSPDGASWDLQPNRFEVNDDGRQSTFGLGALKLTVAGTRLLATASEDFLQHVWTSSDGATWVPVDDIWQLRGSGTGINGIAGTDDELIVTTPEPAILLYNGEWREGDVRDETFPTPVDIPFVSDLAATPDGWMAIGGVSSRFRTRDRTTTGTAWTSVDGTNWTEVVRVPSGTLGPMSIIAAQDDRLVAVGTETIDSASQNNRFGRSMLWELEEDWEIVAAPALFGERRVGMDAVTLAGDAVIAGGWTFLEDNTDAILIDSAGGLDQTVDIGHSGPDDERVHTLCGRDDGVAVAFVRIQSQAGDSSVEVVVRAPDGSWSAAEFPERSAGVDSFGVNGCVHGPDGFLAAGWSKQAANDDIALWRSDDGQVWEPVDGPADVVGEANQWLTGVAATEDGYLLAGQDTSSGLVLPMVWYGTGAGWGGLTVVGEGDDSTVSMGSLELAVRGQDIMVIGSKGGAERVYTTTLEQLVATLEGES